MQAVQEQISRREMERYEAYRLFEEKTDIGERLSLPIENHLELEVVGGQVFGRDIDGKLRRMTEWSRQAYEEAMRDPGYSGANEVERTRRRHEYDEAVAVEALSPGEGMIVFSPIPDAALAGATSIQGYRTDLARTFCRLYRHEGAHVRSVTLTLERSDKQALRAAAEAIGMRLPVSMQSEEVLASRHVTTLSGQSYEELPDLIRSNYDLSLYEQTGVTFFAGNRLAGRQDSMRFINDNHDIVEEHMAFLRSIETRTTPGKLRDDELERLRQRTAAALDERLHGGHVDSIGDTSVSDRMEAHDYGGECATGTMMSTVEQMGLNQGKREEMIWMTCPFCGLATYGDPCASRLVCNMCAAEVRDGKVLSMGKGRSAALRSKRQDSSRADEPVSRSRPTAQRKTDSIKQAYGENAVLRRELVVGGENRYVVDRNTDTVIAKLG
jgi:hypothetical protein